MKGTPVTGIQPLRYLQRTGDSMLGPIQVVNLTTAQRNSISSPQNGMIIFNTTTGDTEIYEGGSWNATGTGSGTVTSVSVVTANGVSGSVATATTTPAITLTLGAITPTSVNGNTITTGTGTLTLSTFTLTVAGTASVSGTNTGDQTNISGNAATVTVADAGGDTTTFPLLGTAATGSLAPATDAGLTYNASTNELTTTTFIGALTGNVTGNVSGTAATVTGATQAAITSAANLATVGTITSGIWNAGAVTSTGSFVSTLSGGATFQNVSGGTNFQFIRLASTGADAYWGTESSSAGAFFTSALAYSTVLYTSTTQQFIIGGVQAMALQVSSRNMVLGNLDAQVTARSGNTLRAPNVATGGAGNIAGASLTYAVGLGTGTGTVGSHIFQTAAVAAAGDNIQSLSTTMTITNGMVGIGSTAPGTNLDVTDTGSGLRVGRGGNDLRLFNDGALGNSYVGTESASNLIFRTNAANVITVTTGGNTGFGGTPVNAKAHVFGDLRVSSAAPLLWLTDTTTADTGFSLYANAAQFKIDAISDAGAGGTNFLAIDRATGNVGIGTTSPDEKLDVNGIILGGAPSSNAAVVLAGTYNGANDYLLIVGTQYSSGGATFAYGVKPSTASDSYLSSTSIAAPRNALTLDGAFHFFSAASQTVAQGSAVTMAEVFTVSNTGTVTMPASGQALIIGGGATASELRFLEPSGSGTNYTAFKAQAQSANITYTLPATVGAATSVLTDAAGNGTLSWAVPSAGGTPALTIATIFETAARFTISLVGTGSNTAAAQGFKIRTGTTNPSSADVLLGLGSSNFPPAASNSLFTALFEITEAATYQAYVGVGTVTVAGSGLTFDQNHYGFKSICAASSTTFSATNGNGTETATSFTTPNLAVPVIYHAKKTGTTNIKFYTNRTLQATHTTNLPSGNFNGIGDFAVSNAGTTGDAFIEINSYSYEQDAE